MLLKKRIRHIERLSEILLVLFEEGFDSLIYELELHHLLIFHKVSKKKAKKELEKSVLNSLERLGGLFIKAGQILSTKPELVSKDFAKILEKLQDEDKPFDFKDVQKIIKSEYKKEISQIFKRFHKKPVSAASLGQVHKAQLNSGKWVAVKVQRPGIKKLIQTDLEIIKWLIRKIKEKEHYLKKYPLDRIFREIKKYTLKELDYRVEAKNLFTLWNFFKDDQDIIIPQPNLKLTKERVLVMDWEDGRKLNNFYKKKSGKKIQKLGTEAMVKQYFDLGTFQGDPHPGNFFVSKKNQLIFLDLGMVGKFKTKIKSKALKLFLDVLNLDPNAVTDDLIELDTRPNKIDRKKFFRSNRNLIEDWDGQKVKEYPISKLLYNLLVNALDHNINLPPDFILFGKSVVTIENVALNLNPKFDLIKDVKPVMTEIIYKNASLKKILKMEIDKYEKFLEKEAAELIRFSKKELEKQIEKNL